MKSVASSPIDYHAVVTFAGTDNLAADLRRQAAFVRGSVPVYARVLELVHEELKTGLEERLNVAWAHRAFFAWYDRPLLLLAAIRADALRAGPPHPLWAALGSTTPQIDAATRDRLRVVLDSDNDTVWRDLATGSVQTNELSRAVAWRWPATLIAAVHEQAQFDVVDIGASAGLNLVADQLDLTWTGSADEPLELTRPAIATRSGYDVAPLDPGRPDTKLWLTACIWPGLPLREQRLHAAIDAWQRLAADGRAPTMVASRAEHVPARLPTAPTGDCRFLLAYQTVMRGYLGEAESATYEAGMRAWLGRHPLRAAWVELEPDDGPPERSARLTVHVSRRVGAIDTFELARTHPHPHRLFIDTDACSSFCDALRGR